MNLARIAKHLVTPDWVARRYFPAAVLTRIGEAIGASERRHRGELRFAVEAGLDPGALLRGQTPRAQAGDTFARLRVWDTAENSGVLLYVQLVDRRIEIVADRGISARVQQSEWDAICRSMEAAFREERFEHGALQAIERITALLVQHFPTTDSNPNELPDKPVVL
ncbi:MAG: hypothetical protein A2Z64_01765 [Betaproteobacteria bacterium RIFCSPLOWO2_02_67_12]|nr:MAG: hypothetical protein A2Z64_01765 [Betaproteobacteria bacterium RIFCSPLOWO2_02_67_12]